MTKADQIRYLYAKGYSVKEVAGVIGCHEQYVRVCARQRANGKSKADKKYTETNRESYLERRRDRKRKLYHSNPDYRRRCLDATARWKASLQSRA